MDDNTYTVLPTSPKGYEDVIFEGELIRVQSHMSQWSKQHGGKTRVTKIVVTATLLLKTLLFGMFITAIIRGGMNPWPVLLPAFAIWAALVLVMSLLYIRLRIVVAGLAFMMLCCLLLLGLHALL